MPSVSGLGYEQRIRCRDRVVQAAKLALAHKGEVHWTHSSRRWDGIENRRNAMLGQFPTHADNSSFVTWCLWNGLFLRYGLGDIVNGRDWMGGFTGTLLDHGKRLTQTGNALRGDLVFYADPLPHVTIIVARTNGVPMVISHGSEAGPFYLRFNYRTPSQIRRYI